ncbi:germination protein, Ger(x)C family [Paenibacillus sp. cl141a]|uniref:Ger(x)C family spore germination protein n=1 Tax=Paenibacillus sp. cl141a TaxID=1761877 RepID=UPI0008D44D25|nr:hypothetical protein [Paenibacillus sp. cl141a]SEM53349.1 germination protein, Ger(x)C family [Paenibacillus sp. cl141a]
MSKRVNAGFNLKFMILLLLCSLLTGCWDRMEIEERAVVLGISIDTAGKNVEIREDEISHLRGKYPAPKQEMIQLSVQIALPGRIPLGPGEGGASGEGAQETVWVLDVVGHTVDDAMMNLQQQISGKLFFGHLRVIVVSEEFARKGMENLNDYLHRNAEVRRMAWLMVSKGKARELMEAARSWSESRHCICPRRWTTPLSTASSRATISGTSGTIRRRRARKDFCLTSKS